MKAARLRVEAVHLDQDRAASQGGVVRLAGYAHEAAAVGAQLGEHVIVLPAPGAHPATLAERLLRATAIVLELGIDPIDVLLRHDPAKAADRVHLQLEEFERLLERYELDYRVDPFGDGHPVEVVATFRGVELFAVAFDTAAQRWLERARGKAEPTGGTP